MTELKDKPFGNGIKPINVQMNEDCSYDCQCSQTFVQ